MMATAMAVVVMKQWRQATPAEMKSNDDHSDKTIWVMEMTLTKQK